MIDWRDRAQTDPSRDPALEAALRRYFRKRVPAHEVDDLVQDVFMSLQARSNDVAIENLERYVFVMARNLLRRRARDQRLLTTALEGDWLSTDLTPERVLLYEDGLSRATAVIAALPERTREVFLLHRFEDLTYARIAKQFGISVSAVEKHIMAALRALKSDMEQGK
jgi:RNA polymerase sigma factor (sigma-70 family)